jgi:acetylornithine deacetylase/succinyl-diaminopimelate desuccinylase-like protein
MGLKGVFSLGVRIDGPNKDLHSGVHGAVVRNPATEMARLLATIHNADGSIAVKGFNDGILSVHPEDAALARAFPLPVEHYQALTGTTQDGGEAGYSPYERAGFRPTIDINGIHSGYDGPGSKTIVPAFATAKITGRTVVGQKTEKCLQALCEHLRTHTPRGVTLTINDAKAGGPAIRFSSKQPYVQRAIKVMSQICPPPVVLWWMGASIPIVGEIIEISPMDAVITGFGLEECNAHAPNEYFPLSQFQQGFVFTGLFLGQIK